MQLTKKQMRLKRARKFRARNRVLTTPRLSVHRTTRHIYAQVLQWEAGSCQVVVSTSTLDKQVRTDLTGNKTEQARLIGEIVAKKAQAKGIERVAFDRSGFKYHGRVRALADAARATGLVF